MPLLSVVIVSLIICLTISAFIIYKRKEDRYSKSFIINCNIVYSEIKGNSGGTNQMYHWQGKREWYNRIVPLSGPI